MRPVCVVRGQESRQHWTEKPGRRSLALAAVATSKKKASKKRRTLVTAMRHAGLAGGGGRARISFGNDD